MYCYFLEFKDLKLIKLSKILKEKVELYPLDDNQKLENNGKSITVYV